MEETLFAQETECSIRTTTNYDSLHPGLLLTSATSTQSLVTIVPHPYRIAGCSSFIYTPLITLDWKMKPQWTRIRNKLFVYEETLFHNLRRKKRLLHKKLSAHFYDSLHPRLPLTSAASTQSLATIVSYPYRITQLLFARLQILHLPLHLPPLQV